MTEDFSKNLRTLCSNYKSMAQVAREIGIVRQQFNRYVTGNGLPSAHNLRRIANYFDIDERHLLLPHDEFLAKFGTQNADTEKSPSRILTDVFKGEVSNLRKYLGFYHSHFLSPTWEGYIGRDLIWLRDVDGYVVSHTYKRSVFHQGITRRSSRLSGLISLRGNRIYMVEKSHSEDGYLSETVLLPPHRHTEKYLFGTSFGISAVPHLTPYTTQTVWKRLDAHISPREAIRMTGLFAKTSNKIDPIVRRRLDASENSQTEPN